MQSEVPSSEADDDKTLVEGLDFYFDGDLMVLTRHYLLARGYCCGNRCRHCPYDYEAVVKS
ncbi:MAG: DUF5522 domain-containing protein [Pyrinomonadaceae bacterium]